MTDRPPASERPPTDEAWDHLWRLWAKGKERYSIHDVKQALDAVVAAELVALRATDAGRPQPSEELRIARQIVDRQAEDLGLWVEAETAAEAYLQKELRVLHAAVERATGGETGPLADRGRVSAGPREPDAEFFAQARVEVLLAEAKWPDDSVLHRLAALTGEVGELAEGVLKEKPLADLHAEAVQVAAMAYRVEKSLRWAGGGTQEGHDASD